MKFVCLGYVEEERWNALSTMERDAIVEECFDYDQQLSRQGHWLNDGAALQAAGTARTLQFRDGKVVVTDGPFAETKEQLGGAGVMEARDMDHAVELMSRHPGVRHGFPFEIRPIDEQALKRQLESAMESRQTSAALTSAGKKQFATMGYVSENFWQSRSREEFETMLAQCIEFDRARRRSGQWVRGVALQGVETAKTVRSKGGQVVVTDGPYAETKEWLGGLVVLAFTNLNEAVELMSQHPALRWGVSIEIRPLDDETEARWEARQKEVNTGPSPSHIR